MRSISTLYLLIVLICVHESVALPLERSCRFPARQRVECGWSGISESECRSRGCCWDDGIYNSIYCFKSDERKSRQGKVGKLARFEEVFAPVALINGGERSAMKTCSVASSDRIQCGWPSISRRTCEKRGCCFERSPRGGPWCYQSDSLLISSRMRTLLQCTWECSRISWKKIAKGYSRCGTVASCWMLVGGQPSGTCLAACKSKQGVDVFLSNVTDCLNLGEAEAKSSRRRCGADLPCWVDSFGGEALLCFSRLQEHGKHYGVEIPEEEIASEKFYPDEEERPKIPHEEEIEQEEVPQEEDPGLAVNHENRFSELTDINVERGAHNVLEVRVEEEG